MLSRLVMASPKALSVAQTVSKLSTVSRCKEWLRAPALSRSLTGGEVREAARNAKAHLLRAQTVGSEAPAVQEQVPNVSSFLNLSVDDRVVVSLSSTPEFHSSLNTRFEPTRHLRCRDGCRKTPC